MAAARDFYAVMDSGLFLTRPKNSRTVAVEVEHRSRPAPPPFAFELPEGVADEISLLYKPAELADLKVMERADEVAKLLGAYPDGICTREAREKVGGRGELVDAALIRLETLNRVTRSQEKRPDRRGALRSQTVWRPV